jgi:hypothetical protein
MEVGGLTEPMPDTLADQYLPKHFEEEKLGWKCGTGSSELVLPKQQYLE